MSNVKSSVLECEHVADHTAEPQIVFPNARETETGTVSNTRATSDDDESKSLLFTPVQSELLQRRGSSVVTASCLMAGAAALLSIGSIIVAALEVHETVVYSHTYAGGTYDEELVQQLLIATIVEACICLVAMTTCYLRAMMPAAAESLFRSLRGSFACLLIPMLLLLAFAVYTLVLQVLCIMWDRAEPLYIVQCVFAGIRTFLLFSMLALFTLN